MTDSLLCAIAATIVAVEIGLLFLAGFTLFRSWGHTFAEAAAYALITTLMLLSCLLQAAFLIGYPPISIGAEAAFTILAAIMAYRLRRYLSQAWLVIRNFVSGHPVACTVLLTCFGYLATQAFLIPPDSIHWENLGQVLWFQQHGSLFSTGAQAFFPVNTIILPHLLLRFHTDMGIGLFGLMAYLSIGFSTYALARRYSWPPTAFTVTMVVMSFPRFVYMATSPGYEIIPAAVAVFCLLAIYRVVERPNIRDLLFLFLGILFCISGKWMCLAFPAVILPLSFILLFRRHGALAWWKLIKDHRWPALLALLPAVIFSQTWLFIYNSVYRGSWLGPEDTAGFAYNTDGLYGALANMIRYLMESAHFTMPVDIICQWMVHFSIAGMFQKVYDFLIAPLLGNLGAAVPFKIAWIPGETLSWFGPFGFFLAMPAVIYALVRGPRRLKATAIALAGYLILLVLIPAWTSENVRFFSILYACGGFFIAFFLPPWRFTKRGKKGLQIASALLLVYACSSNMMKPVIGIQPALDGIKNLVVGNYSDSGKFFHDAAKKSVWMNTDWGRDRFSLSKQLFGDDRVAECDGLIDTGSKVGVCFKDPSLIYPFMLACKDVDFVLLPSKKAGAEKKIELYKPDYFLCIDTALPFFPAGSRQLKIWQSGKTDSTIKGALIQLNRDYHRNN
ncbi:MAG: hypothetical protein QNK40_03560 [Desulfobacterales bacterium]|nr:hypothetical protein [Desulfobacterales bacterium]MDX2508461.1 hypothetical protein [Desulfobacterales bacterium]